MTKHTLNHIVYNSTNEYGSDQNSPRNLPKNDPEYNELCSIVKANFPDMKDEEVSKLLQKLGQEGCGYVAMINSLFDAFIYDASSFYDAFGFSMYSADGSLNYNRVLVDLYCKKDNHNGGRFLFFTWDIYAKNEDRIWTDEDKDGTYEWKDKPYGNNELQMKYRWETYCKEHEIDADVDINKLVTPRNYEKYAKRGSVSILCSNFTLHSDNGKTQHIKGGHFMTITGTVDDKCYIVSSWGKKYYLNPKDIKGFVYYQVIRYKKS